jgi:hypothetical protein
MLTKEQKIEAYSWVIGDLMNDLKGCVGLAGICWALSAWLGGVLNCGYVNYYGLPKYFPEVFADRPYSNTHWFPLTPEGHQKRIKLLQEVIKTLEQSC